MFQLFNALHNNFIHFQSQSRRTKTTSIVRFVISSIQSRIYMKNLFSVDLGIGTKCSSDLSLSKERWLSSGVGFRSYEESGKTVQD